MSENSLSAAEIAELLGATRIGDGSRVVTSVNVIERAATGELAFVGCEKNLYRISSTAANVVIVPRVDSTRLPADVEKTFLLTDEPEIGFLEVAKRLLPPRERSTVGVSPLAAVHETAKIGTHTNIHPHAVVGKDVRIGDHCDIGPGAVIGDGTVMGDEVVIDANAVIYPDVVLGNQIHVKSGAVIGGDGFGYRTVHGRHERLPHFGTVRICDDVEIGACTTIDRAKSGETVIGTGTRIDNTVQIAHNCQIGDHNLLVSQVGIAGSCTTGSYVVCAGQAGIADHVHLGDGAIIGAKAGVHRDMPGGKAYLGSPAEEAGDHARTMSSLRRLPKLRSTIKLMEKQIAELQTQVEALKGLREAA